MVGKAGLVLVGLVALTLVEGSIRREADRSNSPPEQPQKVFNRLVLLSLNFWRYLPQSSGEATESAICNFLLQTLVLFECKLLSE